MNRDNIFSKREIDLFLKVIKGWTWKNNGEYNCQYWELYSRDRENLRNIVSLLKKGNYNEANQKIRELDDMVRDIIPGFVYNKLFIGISFLTT